MGKNTKIVRFDWAIKRLLRSKANFKILEGLLSAILNDTIIIEALLESEGNQEDELDKNNRVDLHAINSKGEHIIIEVQSRFEYDYLLRMLYGTSKVISDYMNKGSEYKEVKKVISINIVYFDLGQGEDYVYHGTTKFIGLHKHDELLLNPGLTNIFKTEKIKDLYPEYYILKVNQFNELSKESLDQWMYVLKNSEVRSDFTAPGIQEAGEVLDIMKRSEAEQRSYNRYMENISYSKSMATSLKIEREMQVREEEQEKSRHAVKEEQDKSRQAVKENAIKMLSDGLSIDDVSRYTGMTVAEIKALNN